MNETPESTPEKTAVQPQVSQQYVVQEKSLQGIGGALIFWIIIFTLMAIGYLSMFGFALSGEGSTGANVLALLFTPILAVAFVGSVVFIALQKKIAVLVTIASIALAAFYSVINTIVTYISGDTTDDLLLGGASTSDNVAVLIVNIFISLIVFGLVALYFVVSKRVKQTLVN